MLPTFMQRPSALGPVPGQGMAHRPDFVPGQGLPPQAQGQGMPGGGAPMQTMAPVTAVPPQAAPGGGGGGAPQMWTAPNGSTAPAFAGGGAGSAPPDPAAVQRLQQVLLARRMAQQPTIGPGGGGMNTMPTIGGY